MPKEVSIFYITPYSDEYIEVEKAVIQASKRASEIMHDTKFNFTSLASFDAITNLTFEFIEQIQKADIVICNISKNNPNVMYELGISQGLDKPIIMLVDNETRISFDVASLRYIVYDLNSINSSLIPHIAKTLTIVAAEPNDWKLNTAHRAKKTESTQKTIFVSYSHKDTLYLERVKVHLRPLQTKGMIELWSDTLILSGEKWKEKIETSLSKAAIALLLISADFLASDFIINNELQPILKLAESHGTIIIPIIVKPCRFLREPSISQFQAANDPINPLCKLSEYEQEDVYEKVAHRIELAVGSD